MKRAPDIERIDAALKRAAHRALYGTQEERSGRFLPPKQRDTRRDWRNLALQCLRLSKMVKSRDGA